jgi:hypothetical protein
VLALQQILQQTQQSSGILAGAFIGWNLPQPQIAKNFQSKYLQKHIDKVKAFLPFFK